MSLLARLRVEIVVIVPYDLVCFSRPYVKLGTQQTSFYTYSQPSGSNHANDDRSKECVDVGSDFMQEQMRFRKAATLMVTAQVLTAFARGSQDLLRVEGLSVRRSVCTDVCCYICIV